MRRILLAFMSTVAAVITMFGYRTSTAHPAVAATTAVASAGTTGSTATAAATATAAPTPTSTSSASSTSAGSASTSSSTKTVTGQVVETRWGPVQVQITVSGKTITAVNVLQTPSDNGRDVEIAQYSVPVLKAETLKAQSASIDSVSGATFTSQGYISSLQSALDSAGL